MNNEEFKIKPTKPTNLALVLDPETYQPLAKKGEIKPRNVYWLARIADGDVEIINETKKEK